MPRKIRPAGTMELFALDDCIGELKKARISAQCAQCPQTLKAIRRALKSAEGAMRHMRHRLNRTEGAKP
jgi:hypothetical protein